MPEVMMIAASNQTKNIQQPVGTACPAGRRLSFVMLVFLLLAFLLLTCTTQLLAQCDICRAGGHCAHSKDGKCLANRTFWGYYQANWRKWPSVEAAEQAAAYEEEHRKLPSSAAPNVVLPDAADEAREGNFSPRREAEDDMSEEEMGEDDLPNDNISSPRRTKPKDSTRELPSPFDEARPLPQEPGTVRPKQPGADLDDPAPVLPVDPNDKVPSLPPNLRDMKPPADENLDLDNLFKETSISVPKPSSTAAKPRSNTPAQTNMSPAERTAEYIRRKREHAERNRQYMREKYANAVKKPDAQKMADPAYAAQQAVSPAASEASATNPVDATQAAANSPTSAATLDELTTLHRLDGPGPQIASRPMPVETSAAEEEAEADDSPALPAAKPVKVEPAVSAEEPPTLEIEEPELLLSPSDTTSNAPLRENMEHARYAARMFTPQAKVESGASSMPATGLHGTVNPLRSGNAAYAAPPEQNLRAVVPASYEESVPAASNSEAASSPKTLTPIAETEVKLSPAPVQDVLPAPAVVAGSSTESAASEATNESNAVPVTIERKASLQSDSPANVLRDRPAASALATSDNPLRGSAGGNAAARYENRGASLPAKTPGTGRYMTTVGSSPPATTSASTPVATEPAAELPSLGTANPLRKGL